MESRLKFLDAVGQVISGHATFTAPQTFNQTTNVTVETSPTDRRPLLLRQRVSIARRVDDIARAEGIAPGEIYRVLMEDYGAGGCSIREVARGHYRSIVSDLDEWLDRLNGAAAARSAARATRRRASCGYEPRRRSRTWLAGGIATLAMLSFTAWAMQREPMARCHWDGREFSIGSVTSMTTGGVYECIYAPNDHPAPYWVPARNLGSARVPRP